MSQITQRLTQHLQQASSQKIIKDESQGRWFNGTELAGDVAQLVDLFRQQTIGHGDVVFVCLPNSAVYPVLTQAIWEVGAVMHPVAATTPAGELQAALNEQTYAATIVSDHLLPAAQAGRPTRLVELLLNTVDHLAVVRNQAVTGHPVAAPGEDDLGFILNTSGTTGKPKRVGLTHRLLWNGAQHDIASHRLTAADTTLITMPMFHINAQVVSVLSTRLSGGKLVITPKFSAHNFWPQVQANGVTWASVVPTIINILLINPAARASYTGQQPLRFVRCSSFSLPRQKLTQFEHDYQTRVLEGYGMTETASQCTLNPFDAPKIGSAGRPVGTEMAVLRNGHFEKAANQIGEIAVKGDHVITRYLDPHPDAFQDGWFLTGDLGYFDADGYLFITGRKKDIISVGGEKVAPVHVENVLSQLAFVKEVTVIGTPDDLYGERVTAVIIGRPGDQERQRQAIFTQAQQQLATYEQPKQVLFVRDYPRNATGKVLRPQLRRQLVAELGAGA